jgi:hypothetical protein
LSFSLITPGELKTPNKTLNVHIIQTRHDINKKRLVSFWLSYKRGRTRLAAASNKVYQLLAHGRWFSPGTPFFSTTKTGRHDIAEILLKVALKNKKSKSKSITFQILFYFRMPSLTIMYFENKNPTT